MFSSGDHIDLKFSLDAVGACLSVFETGSNGQFHFISANFLFEQLTSLPVEECIGQPIKSVFPRYMFQALNKNLKLCIQEQAAVECEAVTDIMGQIRWWRITTSPIKSEKTKSRVLMTAIEITERKKLEKTLQTSQKRFEAVVEAAYDGIVTIDEKQSIRLMNAAAKDMFDVADLQLGAITLDQLIPEKSRGHHGKYIDSFRESPVESRPMHKRASVNGLRSDGTTFPAEVTISKISVGDATEMTAVIRDISERASLIDELRRAATFDSLTGIYNRRHINQIMEQEHQRSVRFNRSISIAILDLDFFKHINDSYGHDAGDKVLVSFVECLKDTMREVDFFGRWGGEEFIIVMPETGLSSAMVCMERLCLAVSVLDFMVEHTHVNVTCSIGVAEMSVGGESLEAAIQRADHSMYEAKSLGRNQVCASIVKA